MSYHFKHLRFETSMRMGTRMIFDDFERYPFPQCGALAFQHLTERSFPTEPKQLVFVSRSWRDDFFALSNDQIPFRVIVAVLIGRCGGLSEHSRTSTWQGRRYHSFSTGFPRVEAFSAAIRGPTVLHHCASLVCLVWHWRRRH